MIGSITTTTVGVPLALPALTGLDAGLRRLDQPRPLLLFLLRLSLSYSVLLTSTTRQSPACMVISTVCWPEVSRLRTSSPLPCRPLRLLVPFSSARHRHVCIGSVDHRPLPIVVLRKSASSTSLTSRDEPTDLPRFCRKFGKHIQKRQLEIPEYAASFVDYKALKKVPWYHGKYATPTNTI